MNSFLRKNYNPDVLSTFSNLSNDEVFTSPKIVNLMLDLLPMELFEDKEMKFLNPFTKNGIFLREIAKRLIKGLENEIPNLQKRLDHIFQNQLYGIAITEITSLLARRSIYCSKYANSRYSISQFDSPDGNIKFKRIPHVWDKGKCIYCGANKNDFDREDDLETHAYQFIHTNTPEEIFKLKFDVIIGNPPYQLSVGNSGGNSSKARAIYNLFIDNAKKLRPKYISMIVPSRWMTKSVEGISDDWIDQNLSNNEFKVIHDFLDASKIFAGNAPKGGVNYFLWDRDYKGKCEYYLYENADDSKPYYTFDYLKYDDLDIVVRDKFGFEILKKIIKINGSYITNRDSNFSGMVSPKDFFTNKSQLTSSWNKYSPDKSENKNIKLYLNKRIHNRDFGWVSASDIPKNHSAIGLNKVYVSAAGGSGNDKKIISKPFIGEMNSVCSQTYLVVGYDENKHNFSELECNNIITYMQTKFFRYLVSLRKKTQNGPRDVYRFVPIVDFSKPWNDKELFEMYEFSESDIDYINARITELD